MDVDESIKTYQRSQRSFLGKHIGHIILILFLLLFGALTLKDYISQQKKGTAAEETSRRN